MAPMNGTEDVFIVSMARTPIGGFRGKLSALSAVDLGVIAVKGALNRTTLPASAIEECIFGCVLTAGVGGNPARQISLKAGLDESTVSTTLNKICASGMKATQLGAVLISAGLADVILCGGTESMSNAPLLLPPDTSLETLSTSTAVEYSQITKDSKTDGLQDPMFPAQPPTMMGHHAELCAKTYNFSREDQDNYAISTYKKAQDAHNNGHFSDEIVRVKTSFSSSSSSSSSSTTLFSAQNEDGTNNEDEFYMETDEECWRLNEAKLKSIVSTPFVPGGRLGTVTGPNSSPVSDGAAALILASGRAVEKYGLTPLAKIRSFADAEQAPEKFTTSPSLAIPKALGRATLSMNEIDFFEINEAFSVVALANCHILGIDREKVNLFGGAVALGHPLGCSGARIICTLISVLKQQDAKLGVCAVCNSGGGSSAMVIERL